MNKDKGLPDPISLTEAIEVLRNDPEKRFVVRCYCGEFASSRDSSGHIYCASCGEIFGFVEDGIEGLSPPAVVSSVSWVADGSLVVNLEPSDSSVWRPGDTPADVCWYEHSVELLRRQNVRAGFIEPGPSNDTWMPANKDQRPKHSFMAP